VGIHTNKNSRWDNTRALSRERDCFSDRIRNSFEISKKPRDNMASILANIRRSTNSDFSFLNITNQGLYAESSDIDDEKFIMFEQCFELKRHIKISK
jgi:hypothetical protein